MFTRNAKYGDALQLQFGPGLSVRSDILSTIRQFNLSGVMSSLRKRIRLATEQNTAVVDLAAGTFGKLAFNGHGFTGNAANENCSYPTNRSNKR